jgi:hypothetical protein
MLKCVFLYPGLKPGAIESQKLFAKFVSSEVERKNPLLIAFHCHRVRFFDRLWLLRKTPEIVILRVAKDLQLVVTNQS